MEADTKTYAYLITGRYWAYVYGVFKEKLNYMENCTNIVKILKEKFQKRVHFFDGGRVYEQNAAKNEAIVGGVRCELMSSGGYAGMAQKPEILEYAIEQARKAGPNYGSYALMGLNTQVHQLHLTLQKYYKRGRAMTCVSGYLAC